MLPWIQGRPAPAGVMGTVPVPGTQEEPDDDDVMGLRAMAFKAVAQDLLAAIEARDLSKTAYVLECFAECLGDME